MTIRVIHRLVRLQLKESFYLQNRRLRAHVCFSLKGAFYEKKRSCLLIEVYNLLSISWCNELNNFLWNDCNLSTDFQVILTTDWKLDQAEYWTIKISITTISATKLLKLLSLRAVITTSCSQKAVMNTIISSGHSLRLFCKSLLCY